MYYTVEIVVAPVADDDWPRLRDVLDVVPGTLLIEDPEAPMLISPVEADSPWQAASFIDGIRSVTKMKLVSGCVYPAPEPDFDLDNADEAEVSIEA